MTETFLKVTLIVPRRRLPRGDFGMAIVHVAFPARTRPTAASFLKAKLTLQPAVPLSRDAPVSPRTTFSRTAKGRPTRGRTGTETGLEARRVSGTGGGNSGASAAGGTTGGTALAVVVTVTTGALGGVPVLPPVLTALTVIVDGALVVVAPRLSVARAVRV